MAKVYVASSWSNEYQPRIVDFLRERGHEVYDFRNLKEKRTSAGRRSAGTGRKWKQMSTWTRWSIRWQKRDG